MPALRMLAFCDLHADGEAFDGLRMLAMNRDFDIAICAGDMTNRGPVSYAQELLELFGSKLYFVHGNMDNAPVVEMLRTKPGYLHGRKENIGEWNLVGIGGSNPTPFNTPSELSEMQIGAIMENVGVDERTILISHPPPKGIFDMVGNVNVGSEAVRTLIREKKPLMVLCGHIHEHEGQKIVDETLVIKLGAAEQRRAAMITIDEQMDVKFFSF